MCDVNDSEAKTNDKNIKNSTKIGAFKIKTKNLPRRFISFKCIILIDLSFIYTHEFLRYFKNYP